MRRLQHQVRLQGRERERVDVGRIMREVSAVVGLWSTLLECD
jgi:hypothetical protein